MRSHRTLRNTAFPPENHVIGSRLLKQNSVMIIGGAPKTMKSMLALGIAHKLCCGGSLWGAEHREAGQWVSSFPISRPHRVLFIEMEMGDEDCKERSTTMWQTLSQRERDLVDDNLIIESCNYDLRFDLASGTKLLRDLIQQAHVDIVIFDPLVEFHQVEENSATEMGKVLRELDILRRDLKFGAILTHHCNKPGRGGEIDEGAAPNHLRGSSRVFGKVDTVLMLSTPYRERHGYLLVEPTLRRGRPLSAFSLQVDIDTLTTSFGQWSDQPNKPNFHTAQGIQ